MHKKALIIFVILSVLPGIGCLYYSVWSKSDPYTDLESNLYSLDRLEKADQYCKSFDKKFNGLKLRNDHSLSVKAHSILRDIEKTYLNLSKRNIFSYYDKNYSIFPFNNIVSSKLNPELKINIYALSIPMAVSYPNGQIHLSRSFIDGGLSFSVKNKAQLIGLITHEFIHIKHGHVRYQWVTVGSYNKFKSRQRKTNWTRYLGLLPISYSNVVYATRNMSEIYQIDYHLECMADFYSSMILNTMGYDTSEYIKMLKGLKLYLSSKQVKEQQKIDELSGRIYALEKLIEMDNIKLPEYLIIKRIGQVGSDVQYIGYRFERYPILKKYGIYWAFALKTMNRSAYEDEFIIYENQVALPMSEVRNPSLSLNIYGKLVKPLRAVRGLVLPEKLIELPIFAFLYN